MVGDETRRFLVGSMAFDVLRALLTQPVRTKHTEHSATEMQSLAFIGQMVGLSIRTTSFSKLPYR